MECYVPNSLFKKFFNRFKGNFTILWNILDFGALFDFFFTIFSPIANQRSLAMLHVKKLKTRHWWWSKLTSKNISVKKFSNCGKGGHYKWCREGSQVNQALKTKHSEWSRKKVQIKSTFKKRHYQKVLESGVWSSIYTKSSN